MGSLDYKRSFKVNHEAFALYIANVAKIAELLGVEVKLNWTATDSTIKFGDGTKLALPRPTSDWKKGGEFETALRNKAIEVIGTNKINNMKIEYEALKTEMQKEEHYFENPFKTYRSGHFTDVQAVIEKAKAFEAMVNENAVLLQAFEAYCKISTFSTKSTRVCMETKVD